MIIDVAIRLRAVPGSHRSHLKGNPHRPSMPTGADGIVANRGKRVPAFGAKCWICLALVQPDENFRAAGSLPAVRATRGQ